MSHYEALYGVRPINPQDAMLTGLLLREIGNDDFQHVSLEQHVARLQSNTRRIRAQKELDQLYEKGRFESRRGKGDKALRQPVEKGDLVAIRTTPDKSTIPGRKTLPMWMAPFVVDAIDSDGHRFTLHYKYDESISIKRGAQDVKRYYEDDDDPDVMDYGIDANNYEVDALIARRGPIDDPEYLVRWRGFSDDFNSWQHLDDLGGAKDAVRKYDASHPFSEEFDWAGHEPILERQVATEVPIARDQVLRFVGIRDTRAGRALEMELKSTGHGKTKPITQRVLVSRLPRVIQEDPEVKRLMSQ